MKPGEKISVIILLACILAAAGGLARAADSSAAQFLSLGFGARALGMGETFVAVADDVSAVYYNPAGLARRQAPERSDSELLISHSWHIQSMGLTQLAYARSPFGFSLTYFSAGTLEGRDADGNLGSEFTAEDFAMSGGYAVKMGRLSAGAALKGLRQRIESSAASAVCADAGLLYEFAGAPVTAGLAVSNIGTKVKFKEDSFPLPLVYRAGISARSGRSFPAVFALETDFPNDAPAVFRGGVEYTGFELISLRAGYRTSPPSQRRAITGAGFGGASGLGELYGFFMGFGFSFSPVKVEYALLPYGELGNSHRFSLSMKF
jgi:hypothetical protein